MEKIAKNVPNDPEKWARAKAQAKAKFDVYPSAYANGWAAKKYKEMGGTWREEEGSDDSESQKKEANFSIMEKLAGRRAAALGAAGGGLIAGSSPFAIALPGGGAAAGASRGRKKRSAVGATIGGLGGLAAGVGAGMAAGGPAGAVVGGHLGLSAGAGLGAAAAHGRTPKDSIKKYKAAKNASTNKLHARADKAYDQHATRVEKAKSIDEVNKATKAVDQKAIAMVSDHYKELRQAKSDYDRNQKLELAKGKAAPFPKVANFSIMEKVAMNFSAISAASQAAKPVQSAAPAAKGMGQKLMQRGRIAGRKLGRSDAVKKFKGMGVGKQLGTVGAVAGGAMLAKKLLSRPKPQPQNTTTVIKTADDHSIDMTEENNFAGIITDAFLTKIAAELDPVGQEDKDIDNDGDHDKSDKYLAKRRKAIGKAMSKRKGGEAMAKEAKVHKRHKEEAKMHKLRAAQHSAAAKRLHPSVLTRLMGNNTPERRNELKDQEARARAEADLYEKRIEADNAKRNLDKVDKLGREAGMKKAASDCGSYGAPKKKAKKKTVLRKEAGGNPVEEVAPSWSHVMEGAMAAARKAKPAIKPAKPAIKPAPKAGK